MRNYSSGAMCRVKGDSPDPTSKAYALDGALLALVVVIIALRWTRPQSMCASAAGISLTNVSC